LIKYILCLLIVCMAAICGGCDGGETPQTPPNNVKETKPYNAQQPPTQEKKKDKETVKPTAKAETTQEIALKLYFPNDQGTKLTSVTRNVKISTEDKTDKYKAALNELIIGTADKGMSNIIPRHAKLLAVKLEGDKIVVDFSGEVVKNFVGGSTGEEMLVGSVVNTLTEFKEIKTVQILVDGKQVESLSGHMDLTQPIGRMENLLR